ncbi:MAG TPA: ABC transporter permease [Dehalococcoidia bacterium]|nr:ABC transporter permease [Dehalococcoidia bacterium]
MAVQQLGGIAEIEGWRQERERPLPARVFAGLASFARRKPLGFICGLIVFALMIIGDLVPVTANFIYHVAGTPFGGGYDSVSTAITAAEGKPVPYVAGLVAPFKYDKNHLRDRLESPSSTYLLGTDELGRDILSRLIYGARVSIIVPFGAVLISEAIAATIGIMSAYYGGWVDKISQRLVDIFQALPGLVVIITVLGIFGSGLWQMIAVIGVLGGPPGSRIIRGQVLSIMASPYIEAGRVIGAGDRRIMMKYVLPNVMALIILGSTIRLGGVVLLEASLSFLGYGLPPPFPSWGQMLSLQGREYMRTAPGLAIYPGIAIGIVVFSYNLLGDALRDVLDPRLRGSR